MASRIWGIWWRHCGDNFVTILTRFSCFISTIWWWRWWFCIYALRISWRKVVPNSPRIWLNDNHGLISWFASLISEPVLVSDLVNAVDCKSWKRTICTFQSNRVYNRPQDQYRGDSMYPPIYIKQLLIRRFQTFS